jgi:hypothetical protein
MRAERERQRLRAYSIFHGALRRGEVIRPDVCVECGQPPDDLGRMEAHHADHARPLDVEWLCSRCHGKRNIEAAVSTAFSTDEWSRIVAKAKREGVSLRALILQLLREWVKR